VEHSKQIIMKNMKSNPRIILSIAFFASLSLSFRVKAQEEDARYALYDAIGKELFPSGMQAEFLILLDTAIPVDPGSKTCTEAVLRLADALPGGNFMDAQVTSIRKLLQENVANFAFTESQIKLTEKEHDLLFEDSGMKTRTANYQIYTERLVDLEELERQKQEIDSSESIKLKLIRAKIESATLALKAVPGFKEIDSIHKRIAQSSDGASQQKLEMLLKAEPSVQTSPSYDQWMDNSGYFPMIFKLTEPFKKSATFGNVSAPGSAMTKLFSTFPSAGYSASAGGFPRTMLASPKSVEVALDIKKILLRPDNQPLQLLVSDSSWSWKGAAQGPAFSSGARPGTPESANSLVSARINSLLIVRRLRVTGPFDSDVFKSLQAAFDDNAVIPAFITVPLRHQQVNEAVFLPSFEAGLSRFEIHLTQPIIIGGVGSILPKR
jgi:hypothetical protein